MPGRVLDPSPRSYPRGVALVRRSAKGRSAAPAGTNIAAMEQWLLHDASGEKHLLELVESFAWRLVAAGLPLDRFSLHMGTLHPQLVGFGWNWNSADGICDELKVEDAAAQTDSFLRNPLHRVQESRQEAGVGAVCRTGAIRLRWARIARHRFMASGRDRMTSPGPARRSPKKATQTNR
jgi:hypothetical protein